MRPTVLLREISIRVSGEVSSPHESIFYNGLGFARVGQADRISTFSINRDTRIVHSEVEILKTIRFILCQRRSKYRNQ